jgi:hypothetical protein
LRSTQQSIRIWGALQSLLLIVVLVGVLILAYFALVTNQTLCDFKRDLEQRRDASAAYLEQIQSGKRELPLGLTVRDLQDSLSARDATLRSLKDLQCSP